MKLETRTKALRDLSDAALSNSIFCGKNGEKYCWKLFLPRFVSFLALDLFVRKVAISLS